MVTEDGPPSSPLSPTTASPSAVAPTQSSAPALASRLSVGTLSASALRDETMKRQSQRQRIQERQQAKEEPSQSKVVSFRRDSSSHPRLSKSSDQISEQSPLLIPRQSYDGVNGLPPVSPISDDDWSGGEKEETKSTGYLALLALTVGGLQIAWCVELSNGSPYLLSLGISKSLLALVWIAGPLSGTLVQPYVGIKSDNCRISWGRRKPFMVGGALATVVSLLALAWAREWVGGFFMLFGADKTSPLVTNSILVVAVLLIYVLDFAINVIQAAVRAFIVDCAPTHQQEDANAWASRNSGVGNIIGYLCGYINLPKIIPFLGHTQFQVLCAIASIALLGTLGISCTYIKEQDPRVHGDPSVQRAGVIGFFKDLFISMQRLPQQIVRVCQVQFFAWMGWFPFLFYITTYVGELYVDPIFKEQPDMSDKDIDKTWEQATRIGTFAFLIFAVTTFAASVVLPMIVASTYKPPTLAPATPMTPTTPGSLSASGYFSAKSVKTKSTPRWKQYLRLVKYQLRLDSLTLRRAWLLSHIFFAVCMWLSFAIRTTFGATFLVGLVGIPWALTQWAPFALISAEISKRDAIRRGLIRAPPTEDGVLLASGEDDKADQAGVVLGIHNVAIAAPQVLATLVSSAIFYLLQKPRGTPGDESVAWVLRFGGLCALVAAYMTTKVGEEKVGVK